MKRMKTDNDTNKNERLENPADEIRAQLNRLCNCDRILSESEIPDFGDISKFYYGDKKIDLGEDHCKDDIEAEYLKLNKLLNLPQETYSMTKIDTNFPKCLHFGLRSGRTHMNMQKFPSLSRGYQGPAIAVAAIATSLLIKPHCWNEPVIDQVIEDGDTYYSDSYEYLKIDDRRAVTLLDLQQSLKIRSTYCVSLQIDDPLYAGNFRSETSKELDVAKALDLFFKKHDTCVLTSSVLNIAIWRCGKYFNIFDGQARLNNCEIDESQSEGSAKLILLENLSGVFFIILEKSQVKNEAFVLYNVSIVEIKEVGSTEVESETPLEEPTRQPSGYLIQSKFRAVVRGSYHLHHPNLPQEFQGRGHLVIAVAVIVYSKLLSSIKWTRIMIDLLVNQSNIYLSDLARVLGKRLDHSFAMTVNDLLCDVVLGVYRAKIKVEENVVPGQGKKGKTTMDAGIRTFFDTNVAGLLELKNTFYAIWKEKNKYYLLDPFACDEQGFRVDPNDPDEADVYEKAACCILMNSSINELIEILLENTRSKDKDPFFIHGLSVLYIKTGIAKDGSDEKLVFREKNTNRRPQPPPSPPSTLVDECETVVEPHPRPRPSQQGVEDYFAQYPELMSQVELYVDTFDESEQCSQVGYDIVNPNRLMLSGTINCVDGRFSESSRGRQGLIIGLAAIAKSMLKSEAEWIPKDVDQIIIDGNAVYEKLVGWILDGSEGDPFEETTEDEDEIAKLKQEILSADGNFATSSRLSDSIFGKGLNYLELAMLPGKIKIYDDEVHLASKINVVEGEANPFANLGEALEHYFDCFDDMLLENNKLMYAVWKQCNKYFLLNPYGNDAACWRDIAEPAAFFVVDSINELVNLLYGLFEFNNYHFTFHYIKLRFESDDESKEASSKENQPEIESFDKYKIKFLPVIEDDLTEIKSIDLRNEALDEETPLSHRNLEQIKSAAAEANDETSAIADEKEKKILAAELENLFEEVAEPEQCATPERLNLALVTGVVKIEPPTENKEYEENLGVHYEKLKYKHPPPFVAPPMKNLCHLLDVKLASKSAHSLLSRFSIDSRLSTKEKDDKSEHQDVTISTVDQSKLITLPPEKYFFSKSLPSGLTPVRAVNEQYIRDKDIEKEQEQECRRKKEEKVVEMVEEPVPDLSTQSTLPRLIPIGPCIMTPKYKPRPRDCPEKPANNCSLSEKQQEDIILRKLVCSTENLLLEMVLPNFKKCTKETKDEEEREKVEKCSAMSEADDGKDDIGRSSEVRGFGETDDEKVGIVLGSTSLQDRETSEACHYKSCYFSAILCVLAKINADVHEFHGGFLDRMIAATNKISDATGKLQLKMTRCFRNFNILGARCNVILKQVRYAEPENHEPDALHLLLADFLDKHQTGIIIFGNAAYAFWTANSMFYLFDPYPCDENGRAAADGQACLMEICDFDTFLNRIVENNGVEASCRYFRLYSIAISHLEQTKRRKPKKKAKSCIELSSDDDEPNSEDCRSLELLKSESETSLIELPDWLCKDNSEVAAYDASAAGFLPIKNYNASAIEVSILENDITRPILAPFPKECTGPPKRQRAYDRKFFENSVLAEPMDLCVMAWSQIYEPTAWSTRTMQALFEASKEFAFDSLLASEDTSTPQMSDELLSEFSIANYTFRVVFAPMHPGVLYANEGWNLAMSLEKIFGSTVYTGAVLVCGEVHIGVMKNGDRFYAWWLVNRTKNIRMIVSKDMEDYLKLVVKEINQPEEVDFEIRIVTISYAKIYGPDCSDLEGLHESMMPSSSLTEIHIKNKEDDFDAVFRPITCPKKPLLVLGTVALNERDLVIEPNVKRCYFVALFAVMLKRDIIQNPLPGMVDKVLELAECAYKLFEQPKYHTEHILKDVKLMGRLFDFRDCASQLVCLQGDNEMSDKSFILIVRKHLKQYLKKCTSGIIHFSNCCYGFWYSKARCCYYYLDPYQCDNKGRRSCTQGKSCLFMCPSICEMVKRMCLNNFEETTGFFIHQIHVESVDSSTCPKFREDPMWVYLDYHWSYKHVSKQKNQKKKVTEEEAAPKEMKKPMVKNYLLEVPNSIYSVWGTLSSFDMKFGSRAGKNQVAICVASLAMQNLCHPSEWSSVVLDSAVVCGDSYYKDSKKIPPQCLNQFSLTDCLKISPYLWDLEFTSDMCGVLYCSNDQPNLADTLENAFKRSTNLLLCCDKKFIAVLKTTEAFYAVDPSWTGPPLFAENHGAIYAIKTKNLNILVYVITKMLNTNYRLEFTITPVNMLFKEEACQFGESKPKINRKKLLDKPARSSPGLTINYSCLVNGCDAVPDEDYYLVYTKNLKFGLSHGLELECDLETASTVPVKKICCKKDSSVRGLKSSSAKKTRVKSTKSISSILNKTVGYPKILNLIKHIPDECFPQRIKKPAKVICGSKKHSIDETGEKMQRPDQDRIEFDVRNSFVYDEAREMFQRYNAEFNKETYYYYKHGVKDVGQVTSATTKASSTKASSASRYKSDASSCMESYGELNNEESVDEKFRSSFHVAIGD